MISYVGWYLYNHLFWNGNHIKFSNKLKSMWNKYSWSTICCITQYIYICKLCPSSVKDLSWDPFSSWYMSMTSKTVWKNHQARQMYILLWRYWCPPGRFCQCYQMILGKQRDPPWGQVRVPSLYNSPHGVASLYITKAGIYIYVYDIYILLLVRLKSPNYH